jgi:hypothetical protein
MKSGSRKDLIDLCKPLVSLGWRGRARERPSLLGWRAFKIFALTSVNPWYHWAGGLLAFGCSCSCGTHPFPFNLKLGIVKYWGVGKAKVERYRKVGYGAIASRPPANFKFKFKVKSKPKTKSWKRWRGGGLGFWVSHDHYIQQKFLLSLYHRSVST